MTDNDLSKAGRLHHRGGRHEFFLHLPRRTGHNTVPNAWVRCYGWN
jgi:hypothetical protein